MLRVWVPTKKSSSWMDDDEVVECEKEVWRSGVWARVRRGDLVHNTAIGDFGLVLPFAHRKRDTDAIVGDRNEGKLISDGKYLRDFTFTYDAVGHLPPWLDMLSYSPGFYHNIVASSSPSGNPVFCKSSI